MTKRARNLAVSFAAISLILAIYFAYPRDHYPIIPALDLRPFFWLRGATLFIKNASDGTSDLLMLGLGIEAGDAMSDDRSSIQVKRLSNAPPVIRYIALEKKLVQAPLESWDTGKVSSALTWPAPLTNSGVFTHDLLTHILQYNGKIVPTSGPTVLAARPDPSNTYVAVLSAEGAFRKSWIPFGDPTVRGDRYHQLFRMSDGTEVGKPFILNVATDGDYVRPIWSADGRYVVYEELAKRLWIIDVTKTLSAGETE